MMSAMPVKIGVYIKNEFHLIILMCTNVLWIESTMKYLKIVVSWIFSWRWKESICTIK